LYRASSLRAACAALLLLSVTAVGAAAQSAWTLERGGYAFDNSFLFRSTDEFYEADGTKVTATDAKLKEFSNVSNVEYGVRDRLGFRFQVPIRSLNLDPTQANEPNLINTGFADMTFGLRYRALEKSVVVSVQADAVVAPGYYEAFTVPELGHGRFQYGGQVLAGTVFEAIRGYGQVGGGYRAVTGGRADLWLAHAEAGAFIANPVRVRALWHWNNHTGDGPYENQFGGRLTGDYRISNKVQVSAGADRTFGGQNVEAGTYFFLGVSVRGNSLGKYEGPLSSTLEESASE
jgi:hypothetical protein